MSLLLAFALIDSPMLEWWVSVQLEILQDKDKPNLHVQDGNNGILEKFQVPWCMHNTVSLLTGDASPNRILIEPGACQTGRPCCHACCSCCLFARHGRETPFRRKRIKKAISSAIRLWIFCWTTLSMYCIGPRRIHRWSTPVIWADYAWVFQKSRHSLLLTFHSDVFVSIPPESALSTTCSVVARWFWMYIPHWKTRLHPSLLGSKQTKDDGYNPTVIIPSWTCWQSCAQRKTRAMFDWCVTQKQVQWWRTCSQTRATCWLDGFALQLLSSFGTLFLSVVVLVWNGLEFTNF